MSVQDYIAKEVTAPICTSLAILATVTRLFVRRLVFWFDDACALLSMLFLTAYMGVVVSKKEPSTFSASYPIFSTTFYATVWLARLSILLTIIRINPKEQRRPLFAVVILFLVLPAILIAQGFWVCHSQHTLCQPTRQIAIFKLVSDVIADLFLLATSLRLFCVLHDKALRFRLSSLFSTCILTTIVSIVNSSFILKSESLAVVVIPAVEGSVSLIVANIPALSSVFISTGEHSSQRASRGVATSIPQFAQHTESESNATDTIIKTSTAADVTTEASTQKAQEHHHRDDLEVS